MTDPWKILLVEDDNNLAYLLGEELSENNFDTTICGLGKDGLEKFNSRKFDLCILDIVLPDMDGISLAKAIKKKNQSMPIVFLTSRNLKSDKMLGYEVGADDYITKPFDADILIVKINAILLRCYGNDETNDGKIEVGKYCLEFLRRKLITPDGEVKLSGTECGILKVLIKENGNPVSRDDIMKEVWGKSDFFISKSLDVYITRIRKILREHTNLNLETIHSFGYSLSS